VRRCEQEWDELNQAWSKGEYFNHALKGYKLTLGKRAQACMKAIREVGLTGHSWSQIRDALNAHYLSMYSHDAPAYSVPVDAIRRLKCDEPPSGNPVTMGEIKKDLEARAGLIGDKMRANGVLELVVKWAPLYMSSERMKDYPDYGGFDVHDNEVLDMACDECYSDRIKDALAA